MECKFPLKLMSLTRKMNSSVVESRKKSESNL